MKGWLLFEDGCFERGTGGDEGVNTKRDGEVKRFSARAERYYIRTNLLDIFFKSVYALR